MHTLNNDDPERQALLEWFSKSDTFEIKAKLLKIAETEHEIGKYVQKHLSIAQNQDLTSIDVFAPKLAILIGAIQGLIDPFLSQTPIGDKLKKKASTILQEAGISSNTYSTRPVEIDSADLRRIFQSIVSTK